MKIKKLVLLFFVMVLLSFCTKKNYNCTCITKAVGYATETDTVVIKNTKAQAKSICTGKNYTSQEGDVVMTCTIN